MFDASKKLTDQGLTLIDETGEAVPTDNLPDLDIYCTHCHKNIVYRKWITGKAVCKLCRDGLRDLRPKKHIGTNYKPEAIFVPPIPISKVRELMKLQEHYRGGKYKK